VIGSELLLQRLGMSRGGRDKSRLPQFFSTPMEYPCQEGKIKISARVSQKDRKADVALAFLADREVFTRGFFEEGV
jgi:hypothetical protein